MPAPQGVFTICTIDGPRHPVPPGTPAPDHANMPCPFAMAAPLAPPLLAALTIEPPSSTTRGENVHANVVEPRSATRRANAARAPPRLA
jgi:hypothetical protein